MEDQDADLAAEVLDAASEVLFMLSGKQFPGLCTDTVRPCRRSVSDRWALPRGWTDAWGWCSCGAPSPRQCGCGRLSELTLGGYPIVSVERVLVDGIELDPSAYRVDDFQFLVRIDGEEWPCCQDLTADPEVDENTFAVDYVYGNAPPTIGERASVKLGCELYQACMGGPCKLPERVQQVTRQGVTMVLLDPFAFLEEGKTGIYEVDLFLSSYNPEKRKRRASIASPDVPRRVRRTGT